MRASAAILLFALLPLSGCAMMPPQPISNPVFVPANDQAELWERTVDMLHAYQFPVESENQLDGIIETDYKVGAGVLEPWHRDAITFSDRVQGSLQPIRRRARISMLPAQGGYLVDIEVLKEREESNRRVIRTSGSATFMQSRPLQRDLDVVVGPSSPAGWSLLGRDQNLEQSMLSWLQSGS